MSLEKRFDSAVLRFRNRRHSAIKFFAGAIVLVLAGALIGFFVQVAFVLEIWP